MNLDLCIYIGQWAVIGKREKKRRPIKNVLFVKHLDKYNKSA
jgi:hypothetical protein